MNHQITHLTPKQKRMRRWMSGLITVCGILSAGFLAHMNRLTILDLGILIFVIVIIWSGGRL